MRSLKIFLMTLPLILIGCIDADLINDPQLVKGKIKIGLTSSNSVFVNDSVKLSVEYFSPSGEKINGNTITWSSSNKNVAVVSQSGYLEGISAGQANIIAEAEYFTNDSLLVSVVNDSTAISSVVISASSSSLQAGQIVQLNADAFNFKGDKLNDISINWESSDIAVLTVSTSGLVQAVSAGTASVTATVDNISSSPYNITVGGQERTGTFVKNPSQDHVISGGATLRENNDGTLTLGFNSIFASSGGPDVRVYLSTNQSISGSYEVASLKSTAGKQTYQIPSSVKIDSYDWVLIHCVPFNITFGWAELK
ncbi:MAG: DM13 domain-containing protein [Ignavibacteriaceae bacterium]